MTADVARFFEKLDLTRRDILAGLEAMFDAGYTAQINEQGDLMFYDADGNYRGYLEVGADKEDE
jgi:hypothetical protein